MPKEDAQLLQSADGQGSKKDDSNGKADMLQHLAAETGHGAPVEVLAQPSSLQHDFEECQAERAK